MMTKSTFFKFLLQNQVPLRMAQRAVEIIDGKARAYMLLTSCEADLLNLAERHVGRYYITPVQHPISSRRRASGQADTAKRLYAHEMTHVAQQPGHTSDPSGNPSGNQQALSDRVLVQTCARQVADEDDQVRRDRR